MKVCWRENEGRAGMKVLLMVSWFGDTAGAEKGGGFHYEHAVELNKSCDCAIYYPYDRQIQKSFVSRDEAGIRVYRSKYRLQSKVRNRVFMYRAMKQIVEDFQPDIIHGNVATEAGRFAVVLGRIFHIPVMITEHSSVEASEVERFPHYYYARFVYRYSSYNACVSDKLKENLERIFPQYSFHTVYNGVKVPCIEQKDCIYYKEGYVNVGMVAGFYSREIKGVQFVLPALRKMLDEGYRVFIHIIGGGGFQQEFVDMAETLQLADNCIFYGNCKKDKLYKIESEMDFMVSASLFESFGCAVAEAAMLGKPVVASRSGGVESIVNTQNGILVEKGSTDAIYDGMKQMYELYVKYDSRRISEEAEKKFAIEEITKKYIDIYHKVIEGSGKRYRRQNRKNG